MRLIIDNNIKPLMDACIKSLKIMNSFDMNETGITEVGFKYGIVSVIVNDPFYDENQIQLTSERSVRETKTKERFIDLVLVYKKKVHFVIELKYVRLAYIKDVQIRKLKRKEFPRPLFKQRLIKFEELIEEDVSRIDSMIAEQKWGDETISEIMSGAEIQTIRYGRLYRFSRTDVKKENLHLFYVVGVANTILHNKIK